MTDNKPWQWAWILADEKCNVIKSHNYHLKWGDIKVSRGAQRVTGFTPSRIANGTDPKEVLEIFQKTFLDKDYWLVAHNGLEFDIYLYKLWCDSLGAKHSWESYINRVIDTNSFAKAMKLDIKPTKPLLAFQYRVGSIIKKGLKTNLKLMATEAGVQIDISRLHQADYDVELNLAVLKYERNFIGI